MRCFARDPCRSTAGSDCCARGARSDVSGGARAEEEARFLEQWSSSVPDVYVPEDTEDSSTTIAGDEGLWLLSDTISGDPGPCGLAASPHFVEIDADRTLRLVSADSQSGCGDNVWIVYFVHPLINDREPIPIEPGTTSHLRRRNSRGRFVHRCRAAPKLCDPSRKWRGRLLGAPTRSSSSFSRRTRRSSYCNRSWLRIQLCDSGRDWAVICWGPFGSPEPPDSVNGVEGNATAVAVGEAAGRLYGCAIQAYPQPGAVVCWGRRLAVATR